jgi:hypothetical protein
MENVTIPRSATATGYAPRDEIKAPGWHGLVAWDMLFNNLSTGLFLVAALSELAEPQVFGRVASFAYPLALLFLLTDLVLLVVDLGDPRRFHHMLRVFKLSSPMSLGVWSLTAFSLPLTVAAVLGLLPERAPALEWVRWLAVIAALVPALAAALYKGVLFSTSSQPGWKDARWLGGYLTSSALVLGGAELLLLSLLAGEARAATVLRLAVIVLVVVRAVPAGLLLRELYAATTGQTADWPFFRPAVSILAGTLLPLLLLSWGTPAADVAAAVLLLGASLAVRYDIIRLPHVLT